MASDILARDGTPLIAMIIDAEGYYSSSTARIVAVMTEEFYKDNQDEIDAFQYSFHELDGKHSETEADCGTCNHLSMMKDYMTDITGGSDCFWEIINPGEVAYKSQIKYEEAFFEDFKFTEKVVFTYKGEEI